MRIDHLIDFMAHNGVHELNGILAPSAACVSHARVSYVPSEYKSFFKRSASIIMRAAGRDGTKVVTAIVGCAGEKDMENASPNCFSLQAIGIAQNDQRKVCKSLQKLDRRVAAPLIVKGFFNQEIWPSKYSYAIQGFSKVLRRR